MFMPVVLIDCLHFEMVTHLYQLLKMAVKCIGDTRIFVYLVGCIAW